MAPGRMLTTFTERAWEKGLDRLSDDELIGLMAAQRRLASRAAAGELAAIGELAARRAGADGCPGEHVQEEVAAALTLTGRAAASQVGLAAELTRLPGVARALAAGRIDVDKAEVFTGQLLLLEVIAANAIAGLVLPRAPRMTTGSCARRWPTRSWTTTRPRWFAAGRRRRRTPGWRPGPRRPGPARSPGGTCRRRRCWPRTRP